MRSNKPDLDGVLAEFDAWRATPCGRLIPDRLWTAALDLLDRYSSSTICRHLRLNPTRFKQVREVRDMAAGAGRPSRKRRGVGPGVGSAPSYRSATSTMASAASWTCRNSRVALPSPHGDLRRAVLYLLAYLARSGAPASPGPAHPRPPQSRSPRLSSALDATPDSRRRSPLPAP
jgi:hypothetical protein